MHVEVVPGPSEVGVHESADTAIAAVTVRVPPETDIPTSVADAEDPRTFESTRLVEPIVWPAVTVTTATTPFCMTLEFAPWSMQVYELVVPPQVMDLPAEVALLPATAEIAVMLLAAPMVHCRAAGSLPEGEASVRLRLAVPPCTAEPEDSASVSVWPKATAARRINPTISRKKRAGR